jgi:hypothetical protein
MKKLTQILTVVTGAFFIISSSAIAEDYVYKQKFMPKETVEIVSRSDCDKT